MTDQRFMLSLTRLYQKNKEAQWGAIVDDAKVATGYEEMVMKEQPLSPMQPYTSRIMYVHCITGACYLMSFHVKKKAVILNSVRCETHRELLIAYLDKLLSEE